MLGDLQPSKYESLGWEEAVTSVSCTIERSKRINIFPAFEINLGLACPMCLQLLLQSTTASTRLLLKTQSRLQHYSPIGLQFLATTPQSAFKLGQGEPKICKAGKHLVNSPCHCVADTNLLFPSSLPLKLKSTYHFGTNSWGGKGHIQSPRSNL